jgi:hypothetical protein
MDEQGIDKALMFPASAHDIEYEFADDVDAIYANVRAFNRWMHEEIGYAYQGRMFLPPYLPLADVELSLRELDVLLETGAPVIQIKAGHAHGGRSNPYGGRSPADPIFDPIWARTGRRIPSARSVTSTPSNGSCTGVIGRPWNSPRG